MKTLFTMDGTAVLLDDEDYEAFRIYQWQTLPNGYISRATVRDRRRKSVYLHKEIVKKAYGYEGEVDHKNGIHRDNQKSNLRPATSSQNKMNQRLRLDNLTGYKGVHYAARENKYRAQICFRGTRIHLGNFTNLTLAAQAYDEAAKKYHGEFAFLNFPEKS